MKIGIKVGDVMTRNFVSVKPDTSAAKCAEEMVKKRVGSLIIKRDQKLLGILTEGDLIAAISKKLSLSKTKADKIMTKKIFAIKPSEDIYDAFVKMKKKRIRWLPVIVKDKVIGVLTEKDILKIQPTLFDIVRENIEIAEEEEKWKRIKSISEERWIREGTCQECGAVDLLYKVGNRYVCASCKELL